ncbi:MAG: BsuPI-related putative proteinase inhibitor [Candidatus Bipolaricaulota bacterium]|nr:BsuPI-related putative proteinase inhibitor [Candidatus Bipolaricaulota bacterium]
MSRYLFSLVGLWGILLVTGCFHDNKNTAPGVLTVTLDVPSEARAGKTILFQLKVQNTGQGLLSVTLGGRPPYDFVVTTQDGAEVWRWSYGQAIQEILEIKTLKPGEHLVYTVEWDQQSNSRQPVGPGEYMVRGLLNVDPPHKVETEAKLLRILP